VTTPCVVGHCNDGRGNPCEAGYGRWACESCVRTMQRQLREIETYAAILTISVTPRRGHGQRRAPGYASRSPGRDDVIVALDYRSRVGGDGPDDDAHPTRSVLGTLHDLSRWVREEQDIGEPLREPTIASEVGYLLGAAEWCARQQWVDEFAADIRDLHGQCRHQAGDHPGHPIGECPNLLSTGECRAPLFLPQKGDTIRCPNPRCERTWQRPEWERLAQLLTVPVRRAG
jgi:hypothetical protein